MIERLSTDDFEAAVPGLAAVLRDAVDDGASVGFLAGLDDDGAGEWWQARATAVKDGSLAVWVAREDGRIVATVSLAFPEKANSRHRAELIKLAVLRTQRGRGLGRRLLETAEGAAAEAGISLLVLDTETASAAEFLYQRAGWQRYGIVPAYAADPAGVLRDCSFYFKQLTQRGSL